MSDATATELNADEKKLLQWVSSDYLRSLYTLIDSNRVYLNQGITWSIGIISAVVIFSMTYLSPLQEVRDAAGVPVKRSMSAILQNLSDGDVILLTAVLSISFAFVSNFMSRSIKGYLNLMRYVGLYSSCLRLASGKEPQTPDALRRFIDDINKYDTNFFPPLRFGVAVRKMLTELGYGLFFIILITLEIIAAIVWRSFPDSAWGIWFWVAFALGPVWLVVELVFLRFLSSYFQFGKETPASWPEAQRLR